MVASPLLLLLLVHLPHVWGLERRDCGASSDLGDVFRVAVIAGLGLNESSESV